MLAEGITAITSAMTFLEGSDTFKILIGVAIAGIVLSVVLGLFFRR